MITEFYHTTKFSYPKDCGNASKKFILLNLYKAFVTGDEEYLTKNIDAKVSWNIIGDNIINGKDNLLSNLKSYKNNIIEVTINNVITHGKIGAANGSIKYENVIYAFCDIYEFSSLSRFAKVKNITSYIIKNPW